MLDTHGSKHTKQPVAWGEFYGGKIVAVSLHKNHHYTVPLYTHPSPAPEGQQEPVAWQKRCLFPDRHTGEKAQWQDCPAMEVKSWPQHDYEYRPLYTRPSEQAVTEMPAETVKLVERLRMPWPPDGSGDEVTLPVWVFELMNEAATALAVKDVVLTKAVQEIERLKNLVGDPEGTTAHAEAFLARAERAEARVAELEKALDEIINSDRIERRVVQYYRIYFQEHDGPFAEIARRALEAQGGENG